jgi:cytochrome o ubiquinol oxidase subunit II
MVVLNPTGDIAVQQRDLILLATGVMLLIVVPVLILTMWFAWKYRQSNKNKNYDPSFHHSTAIELVIWTCPLLIIIVLGSVTWTTTHLLDPFRPLDRIAPGKPVPAGTKPLEIQAVGMDWKWLFIYPEQGIATVNELALPVDRPVHFSITSTDQFNTFFAPTLAGMIYAMPTMTSELHAVLNKTGDSWGYSGNYTGSGYSDMRFKLRGVDNAGFDQWVAEAKASGKALDQATYLALAKPSAKEPVARFSSAMPGLFDKIVNQCVEPGKPCLIDVMRSDMMRAAAKGKAPAHAPATAPADAMPMGNAAAPADATTPPTASHHDAPKHPGMSALAPFRMPGAPRVVQA